MAPGVTKTGVEKGATMAQTVLVSLECCHVARGVPLSIWVGAQEVGDDLLIVVIEQGGLRPEECPGEAGGGTHRRRCDQVWARQADVVLGTDRETLEERLVPRWHLKGGGYGWRCDIVGVGRPRQRDRASHGERSGTRSE